MSQRFIHFDFHRLIDPIVSFNDVAGEDFRAHGAWVFFVSELAQGHGEWQFPGLAFEAQGKDATIGGAVSDWRGGDFPE